MSPPLVYSREELLRLRESPLVALPPGCEKDVQASVAALSRSARRRPGGIDEGAGAALPDGQRKLVLAPPRMHYHRDDAGAAAAATEDAGDAGRPRRAGGSIPPGGNDGRSGRPERAHGIRAAAAPARDDEDDGLARFHHMSAYELQPTSRTSLTEPARGRRAGQWRPPPRGPGPGPPSGRRYDRQAPAPYEEQPPDVDWSLVDPSDPLLEGLDDLQTFKAMVRLTQLRRENPHAQLADVVPKRVAPPPEPMPPPPPPKQSKFARFFASSSSESLASDGQSSSRPSDAAAAWSESSGGPTGSEPVAPETADRPEVSQADKDGMSRVMQALARSSINNAPAASSSAAPEHHQAPVAQNIHPALRSARPGSSRGGAGRQASAGRDKTGMTLTQMIQSSIKGKRSLHETLGLSASGSSAAPAVAPVPPEPHASLPIPGAASARPPDLASVSPPGALPPGGLPMYPVHRPPPGGLMMPPQPPMHPVGPLPVVPPDLSRMDPAIASRWLMASSLYAAANAGGALPPSAQALVNPALFNTLPPHLQAMYAVRPPSGAFGGPPGSSGNGP